MKKKKILFITTKRREEKKKKPKCEKESYDDKIVNYSVYDLVISYYYIARDTHTIQESASLLSKSSIFKCINYMI